MKHALLKVLLIQRSDGFTSMTILQPMPSPKTNHANLCDCACCEQLFQDHHLSICDDGDFYAPLDGVFQRLEYRRSGDVWCQNLDVAFSVPKKVEEADIQWRGGTSRSLERPGTKMRVDVVR